MSVFDKIADNEQQKEAANTAKKESDFTLVAQLVNLYSALTYAEQGTVDADSIWIFIKATLNQSDGFWVKEVTPYLDEMADRDKALAAMPVSDMIAFVQDTPLSPIMHRAIGYSNIIFEKVEEGVKNYLERYKHTEFLDLLQLLPMLSARSSEFKMCVMLNALIIALRDDTLSEKEKSILEQLQQHLAISDEIMIKLYADAKEVLEDRSESVDGDSEEEEDE